MIEHAYIPIETNTRLANTQAFDAISSDIAINSISGCSCKTPEKI